MEGEQGKRGMEEKWGRKGAGEAGEGDHRNKGTEHKRNEGLGLWEAEGEVWAWNCLLVTSICLALATTPKLYGFLFLRQGITEKGPRTDTPRLIT